MSDTKLITDLLNLSNTDRDIVTGLLNFINSETDCTYVAEMLDDVYFIIAQSACGADDIPLGKNSLDGNMYYLHKLRDIFAGNTV